VRLLLFSDLHRNLKAGRRLVQLAHTVDMVVGAGDYATMRQGLTETIDVLTEIDRPTVLVPGNSESHEELSAACRSWPSAHVLHGTGVQIEQLTFWGVGGAIPVTPFGAWSYDFSEEEGNELLAPCPAGAVLISHSPPRGSVDRSRWGRHLGSTSVLQAVHRCAPLLVVCGHIHESGGESNMVANTPVVNAGPKGVIWELPDLPTW
jgi:Icc-related predicted phosphoesterase